MKSYRITLLVPHVKEVIVKDAQAAHNEATKLAAAYTLGELKPVVHSIEHTGDVQTEEIDYS
jgi:hypothetical protein